MFRVTLEVVPFGQEDRKRTIGTLEIANITPDFRPDQEIGDYAYTLTSDGHTIRGECRGWKRAEGAWPLVEEILRNAGA